MAVLSGLNILVPESRELELFAGMLEAEGANLLRCPLVRILDLENCTDAEAWMDILIGGVLKDVIWLTGEGVRRLVSLARRSGKSPAVLEALGRIRNITRGPKPARALRELGISPRLAARNPTSQGIMDALATEDVESRAVGLQLYPGPGGIALMDHLRARGARVFPVTPYRYASDAETDQVVSTIHALAASHIDLVAFTASPQIERLFQVAKNSGVEKELRTGLCRTPIAAVGPVVEESLRAFGLASAIHPETSFHLKPLVRAIMTWRTMTHAGAFPERISP